MMWSWIALMSIAEEGRLEDISCLVCGRPAVEYQGVGMQTREGK